MSNAARIAKGICYHPLEVFTLIARKVFCPGVWIPEYTQDTACQISGRKNNLFTVARLCIIPAIQCRMVVGKSLGDGLRGGIALLLLALTAQAELVSTGAQWRFLDDGSNQGTAWRARSFNDSAWFNGASPLGFGEPFITTTVRTGRITYYFRHAFVVSNASRITNLTLQVRRDDGVVVYVNGTNVYRNNLPQSYTYTTPASSSVEATNYLSASISAGVLREGTNVIAAEVHNSSTANADLVFDARLIGTTNNAMPGLRRGPYLMSGSTTSIVVRWRSQAPTDSQVRYGISSNDLSQEVTISGSRTNHEVRLIGLQPDTKYYYSIGPSTGALVSGPEYYFVTSPARAKPTRIWVIGDSGTATDAARAVWEQYRDLTGSRYTDLWLMLGDNAYQTGTDAEYQRAVFDMYPDLLRKTVLWPALGNHDTSRRYFDIFTMPTQGEAGGVPSGSENYFSFDYGNIHFVCLDPTFSDRSSDGPMLTWLREDLLANTNQWLIAFWHQPPYTKGSHDSDDEQDLIDMRENAVPIVESFGVDLVLAGHSHCYERSFLLRGHYGYSDSLDASMILDSGSGRMDDTGPYMKQTNEHGTVYVVAGSSGHATFGTMDHPAMFVSYLRMGSLILDIEGDTLHARFLRETGDIDDYFTLVKSSLSEIRFTQYQFANGAMALTWRSSPGIRYQVEFMPRLNAAWNTVSPVLTATGTTTTWSHSSGGGEGFYRVRRLD